MNFNHTSDHVHSNSPPLSSSLTTPTQHSPAHSGGPRPHQKMHRLLLPHLSPAPFPLDHAPRRPRPLQSVALRPRPRPCSLGRLSRAWSRHFAVRHGAEPRALFLRQPRLRRAGLGSGPGRRAGAAAGGRRAPRARAVPGGSRGPCCSGASPGPRVPLHRP